MVVAVLTPSAQWTHFRINTSATLVQVIVFILQSDKLAASNKKVVNENRIIIEAPFYVSKSLYMDVCVSVCV